MGESGSESSATETTSQATDGIQSANTEQTDSAQPSQPVSTPAIATEQQPVGESGSESSATETTSQATDGIQSANTEQTDSAQPSQPVSTPASAEQSPATEQSNTATVSDPESPEQPTAVEPAIAEPQPIKPVYKVRVINQSRQALFLQPVKTNLAKGGDQTFEFAHQDAANELASFCRQVNLAQKSDVLRFIHLGA